MDKMMINKFDGTQHRFLSNFYLHPITWEGVRYPSTEHAYQAAKTVNPFLRREIAKDRSPGQAKRWGRKLKLRADWNEVKLDIMYQVCKIKFAPDSELAMRLIETYPHQLIEGNTWGDTFWGVCDGEGQNHLGKTLMTIREELWRNHCG
jgi:ribA/ribD-fused uncharacterized protein